MTDRTENNPLRDQGFWTSPWSVKIKIMRQLVDWNRMSPRVVRDNRDLKLITDVLLQFRIRKCTT